MLYFDESGYTGPDLTNVSQPYFALASVKITNDEIACLKKDIGYYEWGKELHFKSMYTNPQGRAILDKIFNHPLMDANHILPSFVHIPADTRSAFPVISVHSPVSIQYRWQS